MENKIKRPLSIWIAQIILIFLVLLSVLAFLLAIMAPQTPKVSLAEIIALAIFDLVLIAPLATAFWGMASRRSYGRWLGVGILSFMLIYSAGITLLFVDISDLTNGGMTDPTVTMRYLLVQSILSVVSFIVILHISISNKVAVFFSQR